MSDQDLAVDVYDELLPVHSSRLFQNFEVEEGHLEVIDINPEENAEIPIQLLQIIHRSHILRKLINIDLIAFQLLLLLSLDRNPAIMLLDPLLLLHLLNLFRRLPYILLLLDQLMLLLPLIDLRLHLQQRIRPLLDRAPQLYQDLPQQELKLHQLPIRLALLRRLIRLVISPQPDLQLREVLMRQPRQDQLERHLHRIRLLMLHHPQQ